MSKGQHCPCKGSDKNCFKCSGTGFYNPLLSKRITPYDPPYSPRLLRTPSQVEDPGYRSQSNVMRGGSTRGLSSSSKLKCSRCNEVFSGLVAIQNHTFSEHLIPEFVETLSTSKLTKQTQSPVKPRKKISCHLCKKLCNGRLGLVAHVKLKHPESLRTDK